MRKANTVKGTARKQGKVARTVKAVGKAVNALFGKVRDITDAVGKATASALVSKGDDGRLAFLEWAPSHAAYAVRYVKGTDASRSHWAWCYALRDMRRYAEIIGPDGEPCGSVLDALRVLFPDAAGTTNDAKRTLRSYDNHTAYMAFRYREFAGLSTGNAKGKNNVKTPVEKVTAYLVENVEPMSKPDFRKVYDVMLAIGESKGLVRKGTAPAAAVAALAETVGKRKAPKTKAA
jgi:hypothetical protein